MEKTNVKMVYQYDGSKFCGFQRQNGMKTVQGEIEKIIFISCIIIYFFIKS